MKQTFISRHAGNRNLDVIFGGWGASPELFSDCVLNPERDFLLCYDYTDLSFDFSIIGGYDSVRAMAWSMGVWAASALCLSMRESRDSSLDADILFSHPGTRWTAFGGTPFPIDLERGIPPAVFDGTLQNFSLQVLYKFRRRMCGSELEYFENHLPARTLESLRDELAALSLQIGEYRKLVEEWVSSGDTFWSEALAGDRDLIFPYDNQIRAWNSAGVPVRRLSAYHYDHNVFDFFLSGKEYDR